MPVTIKVKDVMDKRLVSVPYMASVDEAVKQMIQNNVWSLVVERKGAPWGVVTERRARADGRGSRTPGQAFSACTFTRSL